MARKRAESIAQKQWAVGIGMVIALVLVFSSISNRAIEFKPLSSYEALSLLISILSLVGALVSVLFISNQISTGNNTMRIGLLDSMNEKLLRLDEIFMNYPQYRPYFFNGQTVYVGVKDIDENMLYAISDATLDIFLAIIQRKRVSAYAWVEWTLDDMTAFIQHIFEHSPFLRNHFEKVQSWYPCEMVEIWKQACEKASLVEKPDSHNEVK
jgi:hypothetical protein